MEPEKKNETPKTVKVVTACVFISIPLLAAVAGYKHHQVKAMTILCKQLTELLEQYNKIPASCPKRIVP